MSSHQFRVPNVDRRLVGDPGQALAARGVAVMLLTAARVLWRHDKDSFRSF